MLLRLLKWNGLPWVCTYSYARKVKMASSSFLVSGTGTLRSHWPSIKHTPFSQSSVHSPLLHCACLSCQLASSIFLLNFILDGAVFPHPSLMRPLRLGPAMLFWGRFSLSNGPVLACPKERSCDHAAADVQRLWQITTHNARFHHTLAFLFQYQQMWSVFEVCWDLCMWGGQMPSKQGIHFSVCGPQIPWTSLSAPGDSLFLPTRAPPGIELQNCQLC